MRKVLPPGARLIPKDAEKVFEGVIFDIFQWKNDMFDGSKATFEMARRADTMITIGVVDGKLLMIGEEQPGTGLKFAFPGGRADNSKDESWLAAAQRELKEETGYSFSNWRLVSAWQSELKIERFLAVYVASGEATLSESNQDADGERIYGQLVDFALAKDIVLNTPFMLHMRHLFEHAESIDDLLALPEFKGDEVDR